MIVYQVLPRLFRNGKFSGFDSSVFSYLTSLGVTHVWYTGLPRHATGEPFVKGDPGSPYAVTDWFDVNPYLAEDPARRMEEFDSLVERTHKAGLKLISDFIPNHIAVNNVNGIPHCGRCDFDWTDTLKVDYGNPLSIVKMTDAVRFWASRGVDGMRCDMVELVGPDIMGRIIRDIKAEFPDFIFIGEVYDTSGYSAYADRAGFDYLYDKSGLYDTLHDILTSGATARNLTWNWQRTGVLQPRMLAFLENHDERRLASREFCGYPEKGYAALAAASLWSTAPFMLYFGQETGESAPESGDGRTSIFDWTRRIDPLSYPGAGSEVLRRYRSILGLAAKPLFTQGSNWDLGYCQPSGKGFDPGRHFAFVRYDSQDAALVFCNFSPTVSAATLEIPDELLCRLSAKARSKYGNGIRVKAGAYDADIVSLIDQNC